MRRLVASIGASAALGLGLLAPGAGPASAADQDGPTADNYSCPLLVAHRGGDESPPNTNENSMAAFRRAADLGVWAIETDVWFTKDNVPVIMHDSSLKRTVKGAPEVNINDLTFAQLRGYRLNNGEKIPTLDEVLQLVEDRDISAFIEYKDAEDTKRYTIYANKLDKAQRRIDKAGGSGELWAAGFSTDLMKWINTHDPGLPKLWFGLRDGIIPKHTPVFSVPARTQPGLINWLLDTPEKVLAYTAQGKRVDVWFNSFWGGDNPKGDVKADGTPALYPGNGWEKMTQNYVYWITTDFPDLYNAWAGHNSTCAKLPPHKSRLADDKCVKLPDAVKPGKTYTVLKSGCMTTGGKKVSLNVKGSKKVAKKVGKYKVKVLKKGKFSLEFTAPKVTGKYVQPSTGAQFPEYNGDSWTSYTKYAKTKRYRVTG